MPQSTGGGQTIFVILPKIANNIRIFFQSNAFNPQLKSVFSRFFAQKYVSIPDFFEQNYFQNTAQSRATRRILNFFRFFYNKITMVYHLFLKKNNKNHGTRGKKVGEKSSTGIYGAIELFLPRNDIFLQFFVPNQNYKIYLNFFKTTHVHRYLF